MAIVYNRLDPHPLPAYPLLPLIPLPVFSLRMFTYSSKPSLVELPEAPAEGPSLPGRVYTELKRRILSGQFQPGEHLQEKRLCDLLEVSRTPLREALNRLGNEDLVVFRPHSGFVVAPLTSDDARKLYELRRIIEPKVAAMAAVRASIEDLHALRNAADMPAVFEGDDTSFIQFCRANSRFHLLLVRSIRNNLFEGIVMSALDQYQRPAYLGLGRVTDHRKATRCHREIVEALEARDPIKAETAMCNHIIGGSERIIKALVNAGL